MKFAEHLSVHTTPEWRAAYINYEVFYEISVCVNDFVQEIGSIAKQIKFKQGEKEFILLHRAFYTNVIRMKIHSRKSMRMCRIR